MLTNICLIRILIQVIKIQRSHRSVTPWSMWWSSWRRRSQYVPVGWCSIVLSAFDLLLADLWLLCGVRWRSSKQGYITTVIVPVHLVLTTHPSGSVRRQRLSLGYGLQYNIIIRKLRLCILVTNRTTVDYTYLLACPSMEYNRKSTALNLRNGAGSRSRTPAAAHNLNL
jgi:hypothetical protein